MITRITGIFLIDIGLLIYAIDADGFRPFELKLRNWRNIEFLLTIVACGLLMIAMAMFATNLFPFQNCYQFQDA